MLKMISGAMMLALAATTANAADLLRGTIHEEVVEKTNDWSGFYVGISAGYGKYEDVDLRPGIDGFVSSGADMGVAAHIGLNYQVGNLVLGIEGDFMRYNSHFDVLPPIPGFPQVRVDDVMTLRGRLGYAYGSFMPFVTAGFAHATTNQEDFDGDGYVYGIGLDYAVTEHIVAGVQYMHHDYSDFGDAPVEVDLDLVQARVSAKF